MITTLRLLPLVVLLFASGVCEASVSLDNMFRDHAVVQAGKTVCVYGKARVGYTITVTLGVGTAQAVVGSNGRWFAYLDPQPAGGPYTLTASGDGIVTRNDVYVGLVVWCGGQSNMVNPLAGGGGMPADPTPALPVNELLRWTTIQGGAPGSLVSTAWKSFDPAMDGSASTLAIRYGQLISAANPGVGVGVVVSAISNTPISSWQVGGSSYNLKMATVAPFTFGELIWWQGEKDVGTGYDYYLPALTTFVLGLRQTWPDLPVRIVQLQKLNSYNQASAQAIRDAQWDVQYSLPLVRTAITVDVTNGSLHPVPKQPVADRLWGLTL